GADADRGAEGSAGRAQTDGAGATGAGDRGFQGGDQGVPRRRPGALLSGPRGVPARSEEHTSELQSLTNLVCRLLLEKKHILRPIAMPKGTSLDPKDRRLDVPIEEISLEAQVLHGEDHQALRGSRAVIISHADTPAII